MDTSRRWWLVLSHKRSSLELHFFLSSSNITDLATFSELDAGIENVVVQDSDDLADSKCTDLIFDAIDSSIQVTKFTIRDVT
jgi:hypothetical protein